MNDNENFLLRSSELLDNGSPETALDRNINATATTVDNPPDECVNDASANFGSLTFVSSKGFFFQ